MSALSRPLRVGDPWTRIEELEAIIADMRRQAKLDAHEATINRFKSAFGLSPKEATVLERLWRAAPRPVSKNDLMDALYNQDADEPELKIVDVFLCKVRRKLNKGERRTQPAKGPGRETAWQGLIETSWGFGWNLTREGMALCWWALNPANELVSIATREGRLATIDSRKRLEWLR